MGIFGEEVTKLRPDAALAVRAAIKEAAEASFVHPATVESIFRSLVAHLGGQGRIGLTFQAASDGDAVHLLPILRAILHEAGRVAIRPERR